MQELSGHYVVSLFFMGGEWIARCRCGHEVAHETVPEARRAIASHAEEVGLQLTVERVDEPGLHLEGAPPQRTRAIRDRALALLDGVGTGIQGRGFRVTIEPALKAGYTPGLAGVIAGRVLEFLDREREEAKP